MSYYLGILFKSYDNFFIYLKSNSSFSSIGQGNTNAFFLFTFSYKYHKYINNEF